MKRVSVRIDQTYCELGEGTTVAVAVKRALECHDDRARESQARGKQTPRTTAQLIRKRGLSLYVTEIREPRAGGDDAE